MRRLDPKSILILSLDWLRKAIYPLVITIFANTGTLSKSEKFGRPMMIMFLAIPVAVGLLVILGGVVSYLVTRFGIVNGSLIVQKKGIWRQERTIPLERIQNVKVTQSLLERILRIATLQVETASSIGVEASLKSLSLQDAEEIKSQLLRTTAVAGDTPVAVPIVYKAEFKDIALAGALQNRALIVMATILGLFGQGVDDLVMNALDAVQKTGIAQSAERNPVLAGTVTAIACVLFIAIGWLLSILYAVVVYYGFKVVRTEKGLQVSYGLASTVETVIPIKRIQSIQTRASWLFRFFGWNQLYVQSIGGHTESQGQSMASGQTMVAPICRPAVLRQLIRLIHPRLDIDSVKFLPSNKFMMKRSIIQLTLFFGTILLALSYASVRFPRAPFVFPVEIGLAAVYVFCLYMSYLSYKRQGYAQTEEAFMVCSGSLGVNVMIVPIGNVQSVSLESSWFLRRRNLVDLHVMTPVSAAIVPCLDRDTAEGIKDSLLALSHGKNRTGI